MGIFNLFKPNMGKLAAKKDVEGLKGGTKL